MFWFYSLLFENIKSWVLLRFYVRFIVSKKSFLPSFHTRCYLIYFRNSSNVKFRLNPFALPKSIISIHSRCYKWHVDHTFLLLFKNRKIFHFSLHLVKGLLYNIHHQQLIYSATIDRCWWPMYLIDSWKKQPWLEILDFCYLKIMVLEETCDKVYVDSSPL